MKYDEESDDGESKSTPATDFTPARFASELDLPRADDSIFADAKAAIRQEFRDC